MVKSIFIAGVGGFAGTVIRYLVSRYFQFHYITVFPWGTFFVNIVGSFLIGIIYGISEKGNILSPEWRLFLTIGFCGGFTTFSSLSSDAFILLQCREIFRLAAYKVISFFLGILAVFFGRLLTKII